MIIAFPHPPGMGGPGSFQIRFEKELLEEGWKIHYAEDSTMTPDVILVVGGTKRIRWLWENKNKDIPIIYRLDGYNWLHRKKKTSARSYLTAEYRNFNNKVIHGYFANYIIFQSLFSANWWKKIGWRKKLPYKIIYNGVDLEAFHPTSSQNKETALVCVEGTLDYSPYAVELLNHLRENLPADLPIKVYGRFGDEQNERKLHPKIEYFGSISRDQVSSIMQHAIYLSLDIHPACPNTIIEALACGAPVVGFDTGAVKELVQPGAGRIVPYGSDPWKLGFPNMIEMVHAIVEIRKKWTSYSKKARETAENNFDVKKITKEYLKVIGQYAKEATV